MKMELVQIKERDPQTFGVRELVGTLVTGGVLMMVGLFAYTKVKSSISQGDFTAAENTTYEGITDNILGGFDLGSVVFIVLAASIIIGVILIAFR